MTSMRDATITLYFDVISPYAYLCQALLQHEPLITPLRPVPVLFAGLLAAHGHKGPAEIERKRQFTYRQCTWLAEQWDIPFAMPTVHPFNPIRYLRLLIAAGPGIDAVAEVFRHLYTGSSDPQSDAGWINLCERLGVAPEAVERPEVKAELHDNTRLAAEAGVFGVPTLALDGQLFWGVDSLSMLRAFERDPGLFTSDRMLQADAVRFGARRNPG